MKQLPFFITNNLVGKYYLSQKYAYLIIGAYKFCSETYLITNSVYDPPPGSIRLTFGEAYPFLKVLPSSNKLHAIKMDEDAIITNEIAKCKHCKGAVLERGKEICHKCEKKFYVFCDEENKTLRKTQACLYLDGDRERYASLRFVKDNCKLCETCNYYYKGDHYCNNGILEYATKFSKQVLKKLSGSVRYFGIEHEIFTNKAEILASEIRQALPGLFVGKYDSSVNGVELVSKPLTLQEIYSVPWSDYFDRIREHAYRREGAGMHVHVSATTVSRGMVATLLRFFAINRTLIVAYAQRSEAEINDWSRISDKYASYLFDPNRDYKTFHGCSINTANKETVEFRLFASPFSKRKLLANIEFVETCLKFATAYNNGKISDLKFVNYYSFVKCLDGFHSLKYYLDRI